MNGKILDTIQEESGHCYLAKVKLGDYVKALSEDYKEYEVQREIVKNVYLDNLIETVLNQRHIPPIVLVADKKDFATRKDSFSLSKFKILDGLQRTFRLKAIYDTFEFLKTELGHNDEIYQLSKFQLSRKYKDQLDPINSSTILLTKAIDFLNKKNREITYLDKAFDRNQWFEIWTGLTPEEEVDKMLILNAGHKPVKTKHQLELLFLNVTERLEKVRTKELEVLREKEVSSITYSKQRQTGQFPFSHLITSLLSFAEAKPLTTNVDLVQKKQSDYFDDEIFDIYMRYDFLDQFVSALLEIDKSLNNVYGDEGTKWMGRETSLVGMFAAAGKYAKEYDKTRFEAVIHLKEKIVSSPQILALDSFEKERNSVDLAKVNIGSINKRAVFNGLYDILSGQRKVLNWVEYFKAKVV